MCVCFVSAHTYVRMCVCFCTCCSMRSKVSGKCTKTEMIGCVAMTTNKGEGRMTNKGEGRTCVR